MKQKIYWMADWKKRQEEEKAKNFMLLTMALFALAVFTLSVVYFATSQAQNLYNRQILPNSASFKEIQTSHLPVNQETTLKNKIRNMANVHGIDAREALAIADCESKTGKYLFNFEGGSAKGIYQFTDKTWKNYCKGDVLDTNANINCFMDLYNRFPSWWECSNLITKK